MSKVESSEKAAGAGRQDRPIGVPQWDQVSLLVSLLVSPRGVRILSPKHREMLVWELRNYQASASYMCHVTYTSGRSVVKEN